LARTTNDSAHQLAELTFKLLQNCQEKEVRLAESYNLTQSEFRCLRNFVTEKVYNNKAVAEKMNLSPSRLTRVIDALVSKGFLKRKIDSDDRRNMIITLTAKGEAITKKLNDAYIQIHQEILNGIDQKQHKPVVSAMEHLLIALEDWIAKT
jgi:DNA-binding MarR family transcriptional regulator